MGLASYPHPRIGLFQNLEDLLFCVAFSVAHTVSYHETIPNPSKRLAFGEPCPGPL